MIQCLIFFSTTSHALYPTRYRLFLQSDSAKHSSFWKLMVWNQCCKLYFALWVQRAKVHILKHARKYTCFIISRQSHVKRSHLIALLTCTRYRYPLVRRDLVRQGPRMAVQIGDKAVDFNDEFKMYLVTRNPHPESSLHIVTL